MSICKFELPEALTYTYIPWSSTLLTCLQLLYVALCWCWCFIVTVLLCIFVSRLYCDGFCATLWSAHAVFKCATEINLTR